MDLPDVLYVTCQNNEIVASGDFNKLAKANENVGVSVFKWVEDRRVLNQTQLIPAEEP